MIYRYENLIHIFGNKTSPKLLCIGSGFDGYKEGQVWQVIDQKLWIISPERKSTRHNGFSGTWQVIEEKSLEEQVKELLG